MIDRRFVGQSRCRDAFWSLFLLSILVKYTGGKWEDFAMPSEGSCILLVPNGAGHVVECGVEMGQFRP